MKTITIALAFASFSIASSFIQPRFAKNALCQLFRAADSMPFSVGPYECHSGCESQALFDDEPVRMNVGCIKKFDLTIMPPRKHSFKIISIF